MCLKCLLLCKMKCRVKSFVSFLQIDLSCHIVYWTLLCAVFCIFFPVFAQQLCFSTTVCHGDFLCLEGLSCPPGNEDVKLLSMPLSTPEAWSYVGAGRGEKKKKDKVPYFTFSFSVKTFKHLEQMQHEDFMLNERAGVSQICSLIALGLFSKRSRFRAGSRLLFDSFGYSVNPSEAGHWC